jgi:hypothetical protein
MTKVVRDLVDGVIISPKDLSYTAERPDIVASIKYLSWEITTLKKEIQVLKEKISNMNGMVYGGR